MLSFNQQNASGANFDYSCGNVYEQQYYAPQPHFSDAGCGVTQFYNIGNPSVSYQVSTYYQAPNQSIKTEPNFSWSSYGSFSTKQHVGLHPHCDQTNPEYAPQSSWYHPTLNSYVQSKRFNTSAKKHQPCISLVPNTSGGFKTIIKRKRKRTMFTTEQVEVLESIFQTKPYVTREDRKVLVEQLQLTDTSVKVWFQNRRLRGKREEIEAAEEALFENAPSTQPKQQLQGYPTPSHCSTNYLARLDYIESELKQKVDESGYVPLDDKSIKMIVDVIDSALSSDLDLETLSNTSDTATDTSSCESYLLSCVTDSSSCLTDSSVCSADFEIGFNSSEIDVPTISNEIEIETSVSTDGESYNHDNVPIYEPISPAESHNPNEPVKSWKPASSDSLQTLFDLHFC